MVVGIQSAALACCHFPACHHVTLHIFSVFITWCKQNVSKFYQKKKKTTGNIKIGFRKQFKL